MRKKQNDTPLTEVDAKRIRRNAYIKMAAMAGIVAAAMAFGSIAWFTMNREVEQTGIAMTADELPFEIAAYGTKGVRNTSIISKIAASFLDGELYPYEETNYRITNGNTDSLRLQYSSGDSDIGPGSSGICDLYVVSKINGNLEVNITMNVIAYAYADKYDLENGQKVSDGNNGYKTTSTLVAVSDINTTDFNITAPQLAEVRKAADYLSGHIMFFEDESSGNATYTYVKPLTACTRIYQNNEAEEGSVYHVPIYWMWPNTLGQLALQSDTGQRVGDPVVEETIVNLNDETETDKEKVLSYLWSNRNNVFTNSSSITSSDIVYHADAPANFKTLSDGYNAADYAIGTNIAYFMIELTVSAEK